MPITLWQTDESETTATEGGTTVVVPYKLKGTDDYLSAREHVAVNTPEIVDGLPRIRIDLVSITDQPELWDVELRYSTLERGAADRLDLGETRVGFSLRPRKVRLFQALEHIQSYSIAGEPTPDHDGAIQVEDGKAKGADVDRSEFRFEIRIRLPKELVTTQYLRNIYTAKDSTNSVTWRGYLPGEARFLGVDGQENPDDYELVFSFLAEPNRQNQTLGSITGISQDGHHLAWAQHREVAVEVNGEPVASTELRAVHIERVYGEADFASLLGV